MTTDRYNRYNSTSAGDGKIMIILGLIAVLLIADGLIVLEDNLNDD